MAANVLVNLADIREFVTFILESESEGTSTLWPARIIDTFINAEHTHLVSKIILANEGYFRRAQTADIIADQEFYTLPADFKYVELIEHRTSGNPNEWMEMRPMDAVRRRQEHFLPQGVTSSGGGASLRGILRRRTGAVRYHLADNFLLPVPFFSDAVAGGLRLWYGYQPAAVTDDTWVPFGAMLQGHHEILAVGAAIRCKKREELNDIYSDWYATLYDGLIDAVEERIKQERKHGADLEGYYG